MPMELHLMVDMLMAMELRLIADIRLMGTYPQCTVHIHYSSHASANSGHRSLCRNRVPGELGVGDRVSPR